MELLREGFAAARDLGCLFFAPFEPAELADCCALALKHAIEEEYVRELIRAERLPPGELANELDRWPWDSRIEALGGFSVMKDGEWMSAGRKAQKKPLEMLRLLVAKGARGMRQDLLAEALWPDADGDAAHHALITTVYRLRRLLGRNDVVLHSSGRVALDPALVFVDSWALERMLDRLERLRAAKAVDRTRIDPLTEEVRALYRGELFADAGEPLLVDARERLRRRVAPYLSTDPGTPLHGAASS